MLLDAGANVNDVLSDGTSALVLAAANYAFRASGVPVGPGRGPERERTRDGRRCITSSGSVGRSTRYFVAPVPSGTMDASFDLIEKLIASRRARQRERMWNNRHVQEG